MYLLYPRTRPCMCTYVHLLMCASVHALLHPSKHDTRILLTEAHACVRDPSMQASTPTQLSCHLRLLDSDESEKWVLQHGCAETLEATAGSLQCYTTTPIKGTSMSSNSPLISYFFVEGCFKQHLTCREGPLEDGSPCPWSLSFDIGSLHASYWMKSPQTKSVKYMSVPLQRNAYGPWARTV